MPHIFFGRSRVSSDFSRGKSSKGTNVVAKIVKKEKLKHEGHIDEIEPHPNVKGGILSCLSEFKSLKEKTKPVTLLSEMPLVNLKKKIIDVQKMAAETRLDFTDQIISLESKYEQKNSKHTILPKTLPHTLLILSKAANDTVMESLDPDFSSTCLDLGAVKKLFQLALLCTKKQLSDRPSMHEVVRVLESLVEPVHPPVAPQHSTTSYVDEYKNLRSSDALTCSDTSLSSSSDTQVFIKFNEVISQDTE